MYTLFFMEYITVKELNIFRTKLKKSVFQRKKTTKNNLTCKEQDRKGIFLNKIAYKKRLLKNLKTDTTKLD